MLQTSPPKGSVSVCQEYSPQRLTTQYGEGNVHDKPYGDYQLNKQPKDNNDNGI